MKDLALARMTMLCVTHEIGFATDVCDPTCVHGKGRDCGRRRTQ